MILTEDEPIPERENPLRTLKLEATTSVLDTAPKRRRRGEREAPSPARKGWVQFRRGQGAP